jgi:hypothetical protein
MLKNMMIKEIKNKINKATCKHEFEDFMRYHIRDVRILKCMKCGKIKKVSAR